MYVSLRRSSAYIFNTHKQSLENSNVLKCKKKTCSSNGNYLDICI